MEAFAGTYRWLGDDADEDRFRDGSYYSDQPDFHSDRDLRRDLMFENGRVGDSCRSWPRGILPRCSGPTLSFLGNSLFLSRPPPPFGRRP
jgi:hypothetical protein